jgi:putative tryptophan/tyrosine transport system substrate-binding protein
MRRRDFIAALAYGAVASPPGTSHAQRAATPLIGFLSLGTPAAFSGFVAGFKRGLSDAGYVEGRNIKIEFRWATTNGALAGPAMDLVRQQPAVIVANGSPAAVLAAMAATSTVPIVFSTSVDPVKYGFVASFNRPGGNVTGEAILSSELNSKRLDLLIKLVPQATKVAYLTGGRDTPIFEDLKFGVATAAQALGRTVLVLEVDSEHNIQSAFQTLQEQKANALIVGDFTRFLLPRNREAIIGLASQYNIPTMYPSRVYCSSGGLVSYAADLSDHPYHLVTEYVLPILRGTTPAELPVQQPTKFEFVLNLKTAKKLGLDIPRTLLATADRIIE